MCGLQRKMQRAKGVTLFNANRNVPQPARVNPDGSYSVLRPTKGWIRYSALRAHGYAGLQRG